MIELKNMHNYAASIEQLLKAWALALTLTMPEDDLTTYRTEHPEEEAKLRSDFMPERLAAFFKLYHAHAGMSAWISSPAKPMDAIKAMCAISHIQANRKAGQYELPASFVAENGLVATPEMLSFVMNLQKSAGNMGDAASADGGGGLQLDAEQEQILKSFVTQSASTVEAVMEPTSRNLLALIKALIDLQKAVLSLSYKEEQHKVLVVKLGDELAASMPTALLRCCYATFAPKSIESAEFLEVKSLDKEEVYKVFIRNVLLAISATDMTPPVKIFASKSMSFMTHTEGGAEKRSRKVIKPGDYLALLALIHNSAAEFNIQGSELLSVLKAWLVNNNAGLDEPSEQTKRSGAIIAELVHKHLVPLTQRSIDDTIVRQEVIRSINTMQIWHVAYLQNAKINPTEEWTAERLTDDMSATLIQLTNSLKVKVKIAHDQQHPYVKMHYDSEPSTPPKTVAYAVGHALGFTRTPPPKTGNLRQAGHILFGPKTVKSDGAEGGGQKYQESPPTSPGV